MGKGGDVQKRGGLGENGTKMDNPIPSPQNLTQKSYFLRRA